MGFLLTYQDFLERVEELGFMALSHVLTGFPSLGDETPGDVWHTGIPETDPWLWKDRAAEEKKLAYGCILGGHKGFVSGRLYPLFYAACHPRLPMQDRWTAGEINKTLWQLWLLFQKKGLLNTSEVRRGLGVSAGQGASRVDAGLVILQQEYYLTVAGCRRKVSQRGQPYGWPASVFQRVPDWAPPGWLAGSAIHPDDAWETILDIGLEIGHNLKRAELARVLGRTSLDAW